MPRPARHFGDPQSSAKLDADALLAARRTRDDVPSFLEGLTIGTSLPAGSPGKLLLIRSGAWAEFITGITAVCNIRGVAYSLNADEAFDIASWFHASYLAYAGDEDVVGYKNLLAPERGYDEPHRSPIAGFTVRVRMRPAVL